MHVKKKTYKKVFGIPVLLIVALAASLLIGVTVAYLSTGDDAVDNSFTLANVETEIGEGEEHTEEGKEVYLSNTGDSDAWLRARVFVSAGTAAVVENPASVPAMDARPSGTIYVVFNTADWTKGSDGYYYYKEVVAPNGLTANLVEAVYASSDVEAGQFDVIVSGEAALASGSRAASAQAAFAAIG